MFFLYHKYGDDMKVYYDLILILNIAFDFLLLLTTSVILKRNTKWYRLLIGSIIGGLSIFLLFIKLNSFTLFILKVIISIIMVLATYKNDSIKGFFTNLFYLYISSIVLGGFLYLLNIEFSYKQKGLIFFHNSLSINFILLIVISPIILYFYIKQSKLTKTTYSNYHNVDLWYKNKKYNFCAFLDTGNKLYDPYKNRPIILVDTTKIDFNFENSLLVPYKTASGKGILKCLKADKIVIDKTLEIKKVLFGKVPTPLGIDGVEMILHSEMIGGIK